MSVVSFRIPIEDAIPFASAPSARWMRDVPWRVLSSQNNSSSFGRPHGNAEARQPTVNRKIHARTGNGIAKEIRPVHVVNVNAIGVEPLHGPRVNHGEPKTAVLKVSRCAGEL